MTEFKERYPSRRDVLKWTGAVGGGAVILSACTRLGGSSGGPTDDDGLGVDAAPSSAGTDGSGTGSQPEVVVDAGLFPTELRESPDFAKLVASGELPALEERIPIRDDLLVIRPVDGRGEYGGVLRRAFAGAGDRQNANRFCAGPDNLLYWDATRTSIVGNVAKHYELSDDLSQMQLELRQGARWSDGSPFTADDILFWHRDIALNADVLGRNPIPANATIERIDDFTLVFSGEGPLPLLPALIAGWGDLGGPSAFGQFGGGGYACSSYLSQFHPEHTSEADANALAQDAGFDNWVAFLLDRNTWQSNPELPTMTPWVVTRPINDPPWQFEANPYSIWIGIDGDQLPYIPSITMSQAETPDVVVLRTTAGETDFQDRHLDVNSLPVLLENAERSGYVVHRSASSEMEMGLRINLAYEGVYGDLLRTTDFRRGISLGIDRNQINEAFFLGQSQPSATMPSDDSVYFPGPEWRERWASYDPEQANSLLDDLGLTERDRDGTRLLPDGSGPIILDYQATAGFADFPGAGEMIASQWAELGIRLNVQTVDGNLLVERTLSNDIMLSGHQVGTEDPFVFPDTFLWTNTNNYPGMIGIPYARWFASGGEEGVEPPPELAKAVEAMDLYRRGLEAAEDERISIGQELFKMHADEVWSIGLVGFGLVIYGIYTRSENMGNVAETTVNSTIAKSPQLLRPMTFYYDA